MIKNIILGVLIIVFTGCGETKKEGSSSDFKSEMETSFEVLYKYKKNLVAYTNDNDSLWNNKLWAKEIKHKMAKLSKNYSIILMFNKKENTPNIEELGMDYSIDFDKHMVCGYWIFPKGQKFCYGGKKKNGNWGNCEKD